MTESTLTLAPSCVKVATNAVTSVSYGTVAVMLVPVIVPVISLLNAEFEVEVKLKAEMELVVVLLVVVDSSFTSLQEMMVRLEQVNAKKAAM